MLDPQALLAVARQLAGAVGDAQSDAHLRRAVSTAYYALFHHVLATAADRFIGAVDRTIPAYAVIYRGFTHRRMAEVCRAMDRDILTAEYQSKLGRLAVSGGIRLFAQFFGEMQKAREAADYDPHFNVDWAFASTFCELAEKAMALLDDANPAELVGFLALMSVNGRG